VHVRFLVGRTWRPPVVACSAARGEHVELVLEAINQHRAWLDTQGLGGLRRAKRVQQVRHALAEGLIDAVWGAGGCRARAERELAAERSPGEVATALLSDILGSLPPPAGASEARA